MQVSLECESDVMVLWQLCPVIVGLSQCFPNLFARGPLLDSKNNHGSSHLAHINTECPDDRYPKLKICISELISESY
jgi:hypothetical protein